MNLAYQLRAGWCELVSDRVAIVRPVSIYFGKLSMVSGAGKPTSMFPCWRVCVQISSDPGEALAAKVYDPDGNVALPKDVIANGVEFVGTAESSGGLCIHRIVPRQGRIEDHHLDLWSPAILKGAAICG